MTASAYAKPLPHVRVGTISGLLELIVDQPEGTDDIPRLAESLKLAVDDLLPIVDAVILLGFATISTGDIYLTAIGQDFATTTILRSKELFQQQALQNVPVLAKYDSNPPREAQWFDAKGLFLGSVERTRSRQRSRTTVCDSGRLGTVCGVV